MNQGLIGEETVRNLLAWRHSGFSVHGAVRVDDRQGAARPGRTMIRCPLALKRLSWNEDTAEVVYTARAIRRSLKLPAQDPEPLSHGPPHGIELLDQLA